MGISVLHIKTEVECRVYLFDEEKGIAKPGTYFNLEVRKGEQDLLFVSTEDETARCQLLYTVEENDCDYRLSLERSQFKQYSKEVNTARATDEEIVNGFEDEYGVVYSPDGTELLKCNIFDFKSYHVKESCKVIRGDAFYCDDIFYAHSLAAITLPDRLTHIGDSAFAGCKNLIVIKLPTSLTHIGNFTFSECENLTAITLPSSLTHIGNNAFVGCKNLTTITLPASLTHIGDGTFRLCSNLSAATLPDRLTHIGDKAFMYCDNLTAITLPTSLMHIGDSAFYGCRSLTSITLPASLTHIGDGAFNWCENLIDISLPDRLTHIGNSAFGGCENLTAITLPASLTYIGDDAFGECRNLSTINLPASLTHIGDGAFAYSGIRSVVNHSPAFSFQNGCLIDVQGKRLIAFFSDKENVILPDSLTHIGDGAFGGCRNLTTITLPDSLTHIGDGTFKGCRNLTAITLPDSLTHIGDGAFRGCRNLTAITLPDSLTHIGNEAFSLCDRLTAIYIPKGMRVHFKALLPNYLHSKLKELEALPKSPEGTFSRLNLQDLENFLNASVKPKLFEPVNALPGQFTINANGTKVRFSMGNLQYQAATRTWHFAEHQWEWVGDANSFTNNGWIDLFEFGSGYNPMSASYYYYHNRNFCDWGGNAISNGGNTPNIWRTLTADEWIYLLKTRAGASAKMATGNIDGVHGLILLPDSWTQPSGCSFNAGFADEENDWTHNTYTLAQWTMMENAGAVFLPAAGKLLSGSVIHVGEFGSYWSSTPHHDYEASSVKFWGDSALVMSSDSYDDGLSVRVVIEVSKL